MKTSLLQIILQVIFPLASGNSGKPKTEGDERREMFPGLCIPDNPSARVKFTADFLLVMDPTTLTTESPMENA